MTLQDSSQSISLADIRSEYIAGSTSSISMGDLYRGGTVVRKPASNNISTDLSSKVPDNPTDHIALTSFYNQEKGFRFTMDSAFQQDFGDSANDLSFLGSAAQIDVKTDIFGDDYDGNDYPMKIFIDSDMTITNNRRGAKYNYGWPNLAQSTKAAIRIPSARSGNIEITNDGQILNRGGIGIENNSPSEGVILKGTKGKIVAVARQEFKSNAFRNTTFADSEGIQWQMNGGQGGASGNYIRYSTPTFPQPYMKARVTRDTETGEIFTFHWTYNQLDYGNIGGGTTTDISPIFTHNADGTLNDLDSAEYVVNDNLGSRGRDTRDAAYGSAWRRATYGGNQRDLRLFYGGANNKSSNLSLGSYPSGPDSYPQPGWKNKGFSLNEDGNTTTPFVTQIFEGTTISGGVQDDDYSGDSASSFELFFDSSFNIYPI